MRIGSVLVALALLGNCGPTQPSPVGPATALTIEPKTGQVTVGTVTSFTAVARAANGASRPVVAEWSSDNVAVASVSSDGSVEALRIGSVVITAKAGGRTATLSLQVVPSPGAAWGAEVGGVWTGVVRLTDCHRVSGEGSSPCRIALGNFDLRMVLRQTRNTVTGSLAYGTGAESAVEGPVSGWVGENGHLYLAGTQFDEGGGVLRITDWDTLLASNTLMVGQFAQSHEYTNVFGPQVLKYQFEVVELLLQP